MPQDEKRSGGKAFNARLPEELHEVLRRRAELEARKHGGQVNVNRELVAALYSALCVELTTADRTNVETYIRRL